MRDFSDDRGAAWSVYAHPARSAHLRTGARLGFRPAGQPGAEPLIGRVVFNSEEAAAFAIRTMSEKELRRQLTLARSAAGELRAG
jgi:hypothetical protein